MGYYYFPVPVINILWKEPQTLYEKDGKNYYAVFATTPGALDKNTTVVYDQEGNICLKFGGLMPPPKREAVKKFFENAENKGTIWECKQRHKKE